MEVNILILSCGIRNMLIKYFKDNLKNQGMVIAADCSFMAPALYDADKYYIIPGFQENGYIETLLDICIKEKIKGVLTLLDPELSILAENSEKFNKIGTSVLISDFEMCELALDKKNMHFWLKTHNYSCAETFFDYEVFDRAQKNNKINYPVIVKPIRGSASISVIKVSEKKLLDPIFPNDELMIQEYLDGQEIGIDCYIDIYSKKVISIFAKKKIKMRSGETDKAVSYKDPQLFKLIEKLLGELKYIGVVDIDVFLINGKYYISEINPRFGGGYPFAYERGINFIKYIINNLKGNTNSAEIGNYAEGIYMMKYSEIKTIDQDKIIVKESKRETND